MKTKSKKRKKIANVSPVGGERFGERFKSHKYMKNNIFNKKNNNLSPIHPTPTRVTRCARTRIEGVKRGKIQ
ncbi:MAG: hypothetical protein A2Y12_00230 [Planctomycetes bacterium GWF2_42_9]|nr:MAG: hypothetical protein A2Y12_00230 [Planctomycetes bacterium GWF2_42_9]